MSESLINASTTVLTSGRPTDYFNANVTVHGAQVHIHAETLDAMLKTLSQFGYPVPNLDAAVQKVIEKAAEAAKPAKTETKKEAAAQVEKSETASTSAAAATPAESPAASPATAAKPAADEPARPTYDDVKKAVLALAKISPDTAKATLAKFTGQNGQPCDHGTKLRLEDYPAFLKAAEEVTA